MTLSAVEITGYRSIRKIRFPVRQLTVLVGGNGVGKTNLYRSLELLQAAAHGTLADEIAREGGLASIFWAGGNGNESISTDQVSPSSVTACFQLPSQSALNCDSLVIVESWMPSVRLTVKLLRLRVTKLLLNTPKVP